MNVSTLRCLDRVTTPTGCELVVTGLGYGVVPAKDVLSGAAKPVEARLSSDGQGWVAAWHEGEDSGESVRVERWSLSGLEFHGYVDRVSRRIVQTG